MKALKIGICLMAVGALVIVGDVVLEYAKGQLK